MFVSLFCLLSKYNLSGTCYHVKESHKTGETENVITIYRQNCQCFWSLCQ